jgi:hypothetical protein
MTSSTHRCDRLYRYIEPACDETLYRELNILNRLNIGVPKLQKHRCIQIVTKSFTSQHCLRRLILVTFFSLPVSLPSSRRCILHVSCFFFLSFFIYFCPGNVIELFCTCRHIGLWHAYFPCVKLSSPQLVKSLGLQYRFLRFSVSEALLQCIFMPI